MINTLHISALGGLDILANGQSVGELLPRKSVALLVYLTYHSGTQPREHIRALLWGDELVSGATNVRVMLTKLRDRLGPFVEITRRSVGLASGCTVWVDARDIEQQLGALLPMLPAQSNLSPSLEHALLQGLALYQGEFLAGFLLPHAAQFNAWVISERARLVTLVDRAYTALTDYYLVGGYHDVGVEVARQWLQVDAGNEAAARSVMRLLHRSHRNEEALTCYEELRRELWTRHHAKPARETQELCQLIAAHQEKVGSTTPLTAAADGPDQRQFPNNLPMLLHHMVGRDDELNWLEQQVISPSNRLLTLTGLGGVGKTHLAQELAHRLLERDDKLAIFANGVFFVRLENTPRAELLAEHIASSINIVMDSPQAAQHQLLDFLRDKQMLLILDNFEHLIATPDLVLEILHHSPRVKVMVTSREPLNFVGERIVEVSGLAHPESDESVTHLHLYPACRLFIEQAFFSQPGTPAPEAAEAIVRICRILNGLPLGIQLAAALTRVFSCRYIADAIERNLDFLSTSMRNVPERQRSLRAVYDSSWQLLAADEQDAYARLAVFEDGFTADAAAEVATVSTALLLALVYRSLVQVVSSPYADPRVISDKRYRLHPVLHQYIVEALAKRPALLADTRKRHARFFGALVQKHDLVRGDAFFATNLQTVRTELQNLRAAWRYGVETRCLDGLYTLAWNLTHFYSFQGPFTEAEELLRMAAEVSPGWEHAGYEVPEVLRFLAEVQACQALIFNRSARYQLAEQVANRVLLLPPAVVDRETCAVAALEAGRASFFRGEFARARKLLEQAVTIALEEKVAYWVIRAQVMLSRVLLYTGEHEQSIAQSLAAVHASRVHSLPLDEARALNQLGISYYYQGRYQAAQTCFNQVLEISQAVGDRTTLILTINALGAITHQLGDYTRARIYYNQALAMQTESGDLSAKAKVVANLGLNAHQAGSQETALRYLNEALELAIQLGMRDEQAYALTCLGNVLHALHREEDALRTFLDALALRRSLGQTQQAMADLAGLAQLAVAAGDLAQAHAYADEMVPMLTHPGFAVAVDFLRVYWDCYTALVATADPRAGALLIEARRRLMRRADQIDSDELRHSYLWNVSIHRAIQEECARLGVDDANP